MYMKSHENIVSSTHQIPTAAKVFATSQTLMADSARARLDGADWMEMGNCSKKIWLLRGDNQLMLLWIKAKKQIA